jgi:tetratricopeptide (TPR) repeat protein
VDLKTEMIREDQSDPHLYFSRHQGWGRLNRPDLALADLDRAIELRIHPIYFLARGHVLMGLGRNRDALNDFDRGEGLDPEGWLDMWGPLYYAECHARLGNEAAALAACAKLKDDHWSPGLYGTPEGNKAEVIVEIRRRARGAAVHRR